MARCWCVTEQNTKYFKKWQKTGTRPEIRYFIFQLERAPTTQKIHIQGYVEFYAQVSMKMAKKLLGSKGSHLEQRQGSRSQARDYCLKDDTPWFQVNYPQWAKHGYRLHGTHPFICGTWANNQGCRTDLNRVYDLISTGASELEILHQCPREFLKYPRGIARARHLHTLSLAGKYHAVTVHGLYGGTRSGKTRYVMDTHGHQNVYKPTWNGQKYWFTDYDGHDILLIDEFYGQLRPFVLQELLDNYHTRLEAKGSNPISQWTKVYITSNVHPEHWYKNIPEEVSRSIVARFDTLDYFPNTGHTEKVTDWEQLKSLKKSG